MAPARSTLALFKEEMKFSAGHFTIFSATERENLHGHNFRVFVELTATVGPDGMISNYGPYKQYLRQMCDAWNETFLLPEHSAHLKIERDGDEVRAHYDGTILRFLARDVTVIPVANVTIEELARLFGERLIETAETLEADGVDTVVVKVASGPGQSASWSWTAR
jgi:6-pyruvoyltetrahydropterin/6-carboxytetrahydropterin synthase